MAGELAATLVPSIGVLLGAFAIDVLWGEPPRLVHPVAWMGRTVSALEPRVLRLPRRGQMLAGALIALAVPTAFAIASALVLWAVSPWSLIQLVVGVLMLKPMFALRELGRAATRVRDSLAAHQLERARSDLRSLCAREPSNLDRPQLVGATVESLAENLSDSVIAPLFYYALFGVPGAVFYRAVNTLDAMIGYRGRYGSLGKPAARLDDLLNLVPARLTALLLIASGVCRTDSAGGFRILRRDGSKTDSPNAGRPMAAMAGLLGVELEKPGHYVLGDATQGLGTETIDGAWRLVRAAAFVAAALCVLSIGARDASW